MGITGLIPFLEKASSKVQLKDIKGCTVAVDTYCWLHKGVFSCADKLCRGEDTDMYVQYCLKYVSMLLSHDIKPILVFDGRHLPAKALTEKRRRENRNNSRKRAAELLRLGRVDEARSHMRRCIDVTHEMALRLIKECRLRNVDCIVAPYEADAQMAFLNKLNVAQYIITEDSDLVLFGCKKIIFKLDLAGTGLLVDAENLHLAMGCRKEKYTFDKFRTMCILSGCDYLDSLPGIGLAKACKFVLKTEEDNIPRALRKIPQYLNMRHLEITDEYIENFLKAEATFKHMYVYNPLERRMERLHDLSTWNTEERYCSNAGELIDDETAFQLALGNIDPFTLKVLDTWNPDRSPAFSNVKRAKHKSIWVSDFKPHSQVIKKAANGVISFALPFKKINYQCKQIEEEQQGYEEGDIYSLYKQEPPKKRICSENDNVAKTISVTPTKKAYNPFPIVSPRDKKQTPEAKSSLKISPRNPFKRSIFSTTTEVRSRFFASNVSLAGEPELDDYVSDKKEPFIDNEAVADEVNRIEELSKETSANISALYDYNSPSPNKNSFPKISVSPITSKKVECIPSQETSPTLENTTSEEKCEELPLSLEDPVQKKDVNDVISLSESEDEPIVTKTVQVKLAPKQPRSLGLSKPKKSKNSYKVPVNQTRLSMFGFQKRPSLK